MRSAEPMRSPPSAESWFANRNRAAALLVGLLILVGLSRAMVLPTSIWEQDEAYFAAAVVGIDLEHSVPHPPFFPLWIGIGRTLHQLGLDPATSLQVASAVFGALILLPLIALWSRLTTPGLAAAAAVLGLAAPGVWLLSARAFSDTAGSALVVAALACWTKPTADRAWLAAGSATAGLAILVRPQLALVLIAAAAALLVGRARRHLLALIVPGVLVGLAGAVIFTAAAGGPAAVVDAVSRHAALHFGGLEDASRSLFDSGLAAVLGSPAVAVAWCVLAAFGLWRALGSSVRRAVAVPTAAALGAAVVLVFALSNPAHPRYAVPIVLLSCGFVVIGLESFAGPRWSAAAVASAVVAASVVVVPAAEVLRRSASPPVAALDEADRLAAARSGVVVVDRTLHAFVVYRDALGSSQEPVVFDHMLDLGASPPPPARAVAVFDDGHDRLLLGGQRSVTFSCREPTLRRLGQDRFLDITVVDGARLADRFGGGVDSRGSGEPPTPMTR